MAYSRMDIADISGVLIWTTRDRRKIPVMEMTDEHLKNAYFYVLRRAETSPRYDYHLHAAGVFKTELTRRGITITEQLHDRPHHLAIPNLHSLGDNNSQGKITRGK